MTTDFATLVGTFIHHCGALEFLTNNAIRALARDPLLSADAVQAPLARRIALLRRLLEERSELSPSDVKSLCDKLNRLRQRRNMVAHNPICDTKPDGKGLRSILVVRHKPKGSPGLEEVTLEALRDLVNESGELMVRFAKLVPEATST